MTGQIILDGKATQLVKERYLVGRGENCDILLPETDMAVSRQHAMIERNAQGEWQLLDISSRNGTLVNNQRVADRYTLRDGDSIRIGGSELILILPRSMPTLFVPAPASYTEVPATMPSSHQERSTPTPPPAATPVSAPFVAAATPIPASVASATSVASVQESYRDAYESFPPVPPSSIIPERPVVVQAVPDPVRVQTRVEQPAPAPRPVSAPTPAPTVAPSVPQMPPQTASSGPNLVGIGCVGALVGGMIGFMLRPSMLGVQAPLMDVLTLGANVQNFLFVDVKGMCVASFFYMVGGAVLGALIAVIAAKALISQTR